MLDRLPPILRHLLLLVGPALLAWLASDVVPALAGQGGWLAIAAGVLGQILLVVTPLTRQYGVGQFLARSSSTTTSAAQPRGDVGSASLRSLWHASGLAALALAAGAGVPLLAHQQAPCPAGYLQAEVHLPGQWIGSGIDPVTHLTRPELVASAHPDTAARYVIALTCIRDLTETERAAERAGLSVPTEPLPFAAPATSRGHWS